MVKFYLQITKIFSSNLSNNSLFCFNRKFVAVTLLRFWIRKKSIFISFLSSLNTSVLKHSFAGGWYNISNRWGLTELFDVIWTHVFFIYVHPRSFKTRKFYKVIYIDNFVQNLIILLYHNFLGDKKNQAGFELSI